MTTPCTTASFVFQPLHQRDVIARFDGGTITSDGGALLLGATDQRLCLLELSLIHI